MSPAACFARSTSSLCARVVQISALLLSLLFAPTHTQSLADTLPAPTYEIFANPLGIQGALLMRSNGEDIGGDIVYKADGQITSNGYIVEMAIPSSSLRSTFAVQTSTFTASDRAIFR